MCGYNSFDYLESCKKCGAPLYGEDSSGVPVSDASENQGKESDLISGNKRDEVSPEELLENPISDRREADDDERSMSARFSESETEDYIGNEVEDASSEGLSISNRSERSDLSRPGHEAADRSTDNQMDLFEKGGQSAHTEEREFAFTEERRDARQRIRESEYENHESEALVFTLAGFISRAFAFLIDVFIVSLTPLLAIISGLYMLDGVNVDNEALKRVIIPVYLALFFLASTYFVFLHGLTGQTVGKMILGIRIINGEGETIGLWDGFVRWIGYFISAAFLFIGFLWALFDSEGQTWHDKIAGSYVVKD